MRTGIDFGRVISGGATADGVDSDFLRGRIEDALNTPPLPGMWPAVTALVELAGGNAWIVSKCGEQVQRRTLAWLAHHDFHRRTGLPAGNVRFCRRRPDKAVHAAELGLTHFVDDRLDVLHHLRPVLAHRYLFGPQPEPAPDWVIATPTWADVLTAVTASVPSGR